MKIFIIIIHIKRALQKIMSFVMKIFLRLVGAKIGKNVYISFSARIVGEKIAIGNDTKILEKVKIKAKEINIGSGVIISSNSMITGKSNLTIGDASYLGKNSRIDLSRDVKLGKDVGFGENSVVWTHGYFPPYDKGFPLTFKSVSICDGAWVSTNIIVLPGVSVGKDVIVGAGSVLTQSVEDGKIVAGNPAKYLKETKSILHRKSFFQIMLEVLSKFNEKKIENVFDKEKFLQIKYDEYSIFVVEKGFNHINQINSNRLNVVFAKDCSNDFFDKIKVCWFNYNKRTSKECSYGHVLKIRVHLRNYGIRYLVSYNQNA